MFLGAANCTEKIEKPIAHKDLTYQNPNAHATKNSHELQKTLNRKSYAFNENYPLMLAIWLFYLASYCSTWLQLLCIVLFKNYSSPKAFRHIHFDASVCLFNSCFM